MSATALSIPPAIEVSTTLGPVACIVEGQGPALVAVHGGMGGVEQAWLLARALLGESAVEYRIIAVARPGYPGTPLSAGPDPDAQADLHAAVLDALGERSALIAAVSAGGPSAIRFALRHPVRCDGLILVSTCTGRLETPASVRSRMRLMRILAAIPGIPAALRRRHARKPSASLERGVSDPAVRARTEGHPEAMALLRALSASVLHRLGARLPGTANDIRRFHALEESALEDLAAAVLIVHGTADPVVPFSHGDSVARRAPGASILAIEGGEHLVLFTHLDLVRERTARFLAALSP